MRSPIMFFCTDEVPPAIVSVSTVEDAPQPVAVGREGRAALEQRVLAQQPAENLIIRCVSSVETSLPIELSGPGS